MKARDGSQLTAFAKGYGASAEASREGGSVRLRVNGGIRSCRPPATGY